MILEMGLSFGAINKRNAYKFRRQMINCLYGGQFKGDSRCVFLVVGHFQQFYFIPAASLRFVKIHSALAAFFSFGSKQLRGCQFIHAIMKIYKHTAADSEVRNHQYQDTCFFHERCKDSTPLPIPKTAFPKWLIF